MKSRLLITVLLSVASLGASVVYTDNFNSGPQLAWENQRGNWTAAGGVYYAQAPGSSPVTASLLPYVLTDFTVEYDINSLGDGGAWLRADPAANSGIMFIVRGWGDAYWHVISDPVSGPWFIYGYAATGLGWGSNVHVRLEASGNTFTAYLNGSLVTSLNMPGYPAGRFGLYDFSWNPYNTYDNVVLTDLNGSAGVPEPGSWLLAVAGATALRVFRRRRAGYTR